MEPYSVVAFNTATTSMNKIHDDAVATSLGFRGGLVPGVDVYAYLSQGPVRQWGRAWLERGSISARFHQPVYDGDRVLVAEDRDDPTAMVLTDPRGTVCARARAALPVLAPAVDASLWPKPGDLVTIPPASPESLAPGTAFELPAHRFHAEAAGEYLDAVREVHPIYRREGIAHPGWILRDANYVLSANVVLGPWIHVSSEVQHHGLVRDGDLVSARALVTEEWERKGHRFVRLDVLHLAGQSVVARTDHVAIYRPRGT